MKRKDYYGILGVAKDADATEIRMAYRKMALQNHPDTNMDDPDAEDRFKEIHEAYDVLSHREKRNQFDLGGNSQARGFPLYRSPFGSWDDPFEAEFFPGMRCRGGGLGRVFASNRRVFRGGGQRPAGFVPRESNRPIHDLTVTSGEAAGGTERDIRLHTGSDPLVFTVSIPAGVANGTLLNFRQPIEGGQVLEFLFRVKIEE